tara:strand:- start:631 stop:831 length:201 start_codon:yes stop_codon:yes gene_type:complete
MYIEELVVNVQKRGTYSMFLIFSMVANWVSVIKEKEYVCFSKTESLTIQSKRKEVMNFRKWKKENI